MSGSVMATFSPIAPLEFARPRNVVSCSPLMVYEVSLSSRSACGSSISFKSSSFQTSILANRERKAVIMCRAAAEYKFPDPIPEFAEETDKFKKHLIEKLSQKDVYKGSAEAVADVCTEIFSNFLLTEYGGPGTLLVVPFIDMAETVHERGLPGASQAARVAVKWAQSHVDKDWKEWTGTD